MAENILFQARLNCGTSIIQILPGEEAGKFILSTRESDHLWSIDGQQEDERTYSDRTRIRKWIQHQQSPLHLICFEGATARIYAWNDWSEVAVLLLTTDIMELPLKSVTPFTLGRRQRLLLEFSGPDGSADTHSLYLFDAATFDNENKPAKGAVSEPAKAINCADTVSVREGAAAATVLIPRLSPQLAALGHEVAHIVGLTDGGKLIFLNTHSWVCSADLEALGNSSVLYSRHFFVPYDWFSGTRDVICAVAQRDILFAHNDNVAIVKGGLEHSKDVSVELEGLEMKGH